MENTNNNMSELDVSSLNDVDLAQQLRELGADVGPITNSTRAVYQRKLQRLLKYESSDGVSSNSSYSHQSLDNSHFELPHVEPENEPTIKYTATKQPVKKSTLSNDGDNVKKNSKLDRLEDDFSTISHSVAHDKVGDTKVKDSSKRRVVENHRQLPVVSQEDIELVDRVMAQSSQSAKSNTTSYSYQSTSNKEFKRTELHDNESVLRSRYNLHNVTPRQSLSSYKGLNTTSDNVWTGLGSFTTTPVRQGSAMQPSALALSDSTSKKKSWSPIISFVVVGIAAVLLLSAIIWNLEPAYSTPLKQ